MHFSHCFCFGAHVQKVLYYTDKILEATKKSKQSDAGFLRTRLFFTHSITQSPENIYFLIKMFKKRCAEIFLS